MPAGHSFPKLVWETGGVDSCSKRRAHPLGIAKGLFIIQLSPRGDFCKAVSAICSREAACFLVISKKNHQYIMGREERIITDYHECGMCHVDALLCCVFSSSSYSWSLMCFSFFLYFKRVVVVACVYVYLSLILQMERVWHKVVKPCESLFRSGIRLIDSSSIICVQAM